MGSSFFNLFFSCSQPKGKVNSEPDYSKVTWSCNRESFCREEEEENRYFCCFHYSSHCLHLVSHFLFHTLHIPTAEVIAPTEKVKWKKRRFSVLCFIETKDRLAISTRGIRYWHIKQGQNTIMGPRLVWGYLCVKQLKNRKHSAWQLLSYAHYRHTSFY